ncbi:MAG: Glu/Leu/Phe/Val dehydrogenase [Alphaproteobacteria bacterium]|nr:Glu/Leu/Phe/Val dehydrogenase [Alphaproteobacteria bacterium]
MSTFSSDHFENHEQVVFCCDHESGLRAIIAIHNTNRGPSLGGCRMWPYESEEHAIADVLRLSRGMTYKSAIANLPLGGGKSVIIGDPQKHKSRQLFEAMGRFVDSLGGRYIVAEDVGISVEDIDIIRSQTRYAAGHSGGSGNPSPSTAYGVFLGIRAALAFRHHRSSFKGLKVAVQGLGSVGYALCEYLAAEGAELFVTDIKEESIARAVQELGATAVAPEDIYGLDVDIYAPCALGAVINDDTLHNIKAKIIAGAANNQLAADRHGQALADLGILYAPDYVLNAGGVISVASEGPRVDKSDVPDLIEGIYDTLMEIFARAEAEGRPTNVIADRLAEERFAKV